MNKAQAFKELMRDSSGYYNPYYDFVDELVREAMKENIRDFVKTDYDQYETVDNKSADLAAFCRVLQWYSLPDEYRKFMKELQSD